MLASIPQELATAGIGIARHRVERLDGAEYTQSSLRI
jgi:hypothetical protein